MPPVTTVQPYLPVKESLVQPETGALTPVGLAWFQQQAANIAAMAASLNIVIGVNVATVATQPTLGAGDAGYILFLTDYEHTLRWTGATWKFFGGSNGYFTDLPFVPQGGAWQLCDGTAVNYLTLGASLTETSFTTPNLIGTPAYRKAAAAYTGAIAAKVAPSSTGTGTTGTGTTGTGTSGDESAHVHSLNAVIGTIVNAGANSPAISIGTNNAWEVTFSANTGAGSAHNHSVPGLSVPGLSVPALSISTIEMANLGCLPYFRR